MSISAAAGQEDRKPIPLGGTSSHPGQTVTRRRVPAQSHGANLQTSPRKKDQNIKLKKNRRGALPQQKNYPEKRLPKAKNFRGKRSNKEGPAWSGVTRR